MELLYDTLKLLYDILKMVWCCILTGHSDGDVSWCSGCGLRVGGAEWLQADGRLVAVAQWRPLAA